MLRRSRVGDMTSVQYYVPKGKIVLLLFFTVHYKEGEKREKSFSATGLVGFSNVEVHTTHLPICSIAERSQKQGNQLTLPEKSAAGRRRRSSNLGRQIAKFIFFSVLLIFLPSLPPSPRPVAEEPPQLLRGVAHGNLEGRATDLRSVRPSSCAL